MNTRIFWAMLSVWWVMASQAHAEQVLLIAGPNGLGNGTFYLNMVDQISPGANLNAYEVRMPTAGSFHMLYAEVENAPNTEASADTQTAQFTLVVNGVASLLTCTITESDTTCCDSSDSVSVVANDLVALQFIGTQIDPPGGPASTIGRSRLSMRFTPTTTDENIIFGGTGTADIMGLNRNYIAPPHGEALAGVGLQSGDADEANGEMLFPVAGTVKSFYVHSSSTASGPDNCLTFTIRKNGVNSSVTCSMAKGAKDCSDTSNTLSVVSGDGISIENAIACSFPHNPFFPEWSMVFVPNTTGVFLIPSSTYDTTLLNSDTSFVAPMGANYTTGGTELLRASPGQSCTFQTLTTKVTTAPDTGAGTQQYTITFRKNAADTALACTISEAATTCSDTTNAISSTVTDRLSFSVVPSGTPTSTAMRISVLGSSCSDENDPCAGGDWGWTQRP